MKIRLMTEADLIAVAEIEKLIFSIPWSVQAFKDSLYNDNTIYFVATEDDVVIGYCGMYISFEEGNITNVAVDSACRRKGVAQKLLNKLITMATQKGVNNIFLEVRETNVAAIKLYEHLGFREAGIRRNFYEKPTENAIIMWKNNQ